MITRFIRSLLFAVVMLTGASFAQVRVAIRFGPPPLPVYEQPVCPGEDYIWVPGYWAYDYDYSDYYWVPGTWVLAPEPGYFWTPGYWGWENEAFLFHEGYWGPHVGFYGGINYGYGYFGDGYEGGRWDRGHFFYNRAVNNVNVAVVRNVYNTTVINKTTVVNRVSYNGGNGGINVRPRPEEEVAARDRHIAPVSAQTEHMREARSDPQQRASANRGRPEVAATPKPAAFKDHAVVHASQAGGAWNPSANRNNAGDNGGLNHDNRAQNNNVPRPGNNIVHPKDIPQAEHPAPPNTGDAKRDQKYQQQQEKMYAKQEQQRQKLEQKQEQEHQRMQQQKADEQRQQQIEQHHQQQTQKLEHQQEQQIQKMQARQEPRPHSMNALKPKP